MRRSAGIAIAIACVTHFGITGCGGGEEPAVSTTPAPQAAAPPAPTVQQISREAQRCLGCASGARLSQEKCASCLNCMRVCPHDAPGIKVGGYLYFDAEACHACGACASLCPAQAIALEGYSEEELSRRVERLLVDHGLDTMLVFGCGCTPNLPEIASADVRTLTTTCLLRVSERNVLEALQLGAGQVVFAGCIEANCRFPHARELVAQLTARIKASLAQVDMEGSFVVFGEADDEELTHLI